MSTEAKALELKVGLFVFAGLAVIAAMVVKFGLVGQGLKNFYPVTIEFANASGLVQGSDVLLAGARIGYVADRPRIANGKLSVIVPLKIREDVKIPREVNFTVGSSGLLGDRYVNVAPKPGFNVANFNPQEESQVLESGAYLKGAISSGGMDELTEKGGEAVEQLKVELARIGEAIERVKTGVLSDQNINNLQLTFANLKKTTDHLSTASDGIKTVVTDAKVVVKNAQGVVDTAQKTMTSADETMQTANGAATDLRGAISDVQTLVKKANTGPGILPTMLNDKKVSDDVRSLAENLRRHGVLFYKDSAIPTRRANPSPLRQ